MLFSRKLALPLAAITAVFYGMVTPFSHRLYEAGANPATLFVIRYLAMSVLLGLGLLWLNRWRLSGLRWTLLGGLALSWFAVTAGHLGAVKFIPVSLSAIIFYLFPLFTVAYSAFVDKRSYRPFEFGAFALAFIGIAVALGLSFEVLDWRGIALSLLAALGAATFLLLHEKVGEQNHPMVLMFWLSLICLGLSCLHLGLTMHIALPITSQGWGALFAVVAFSTVGILLNIYVLRLIGAPRTALLLNLEPIVIMLMAWWLIDEPMTFAKVTGIVLICVAILLVNKPQMNQFTPAKKITL